MLPKLSSDWLGMVLLECVWCATISCLLFLAFLPTACHRNVNSLVKMPFLLQKFLTLIRFPYRWAGRGFLLCHLSTQRSLYSSEEGVGRINWCHLHVNIQLYLTTNNSMCNPINIGKILTFGWQSLVRKSLCFSIVFIIPSATNLLLSSVSFLFPLISNVQTFHVCGNPLFFPFHVPQLQISIWTNRENVDCHQRLVQENLPRSHLYMGFHVQPQLQPSIAFQWHSTSSW